MKRILLLILSAAIPLLHAAQGILIEDATLQQQLPSTNFGALPQLQVGQSSTVMLRFALPPGLQAANVQNVILRLYASRVATPGSVDWAFVESPWSEKTITYANAPGAYPASDTFIVSTANTFISIDVTKAVQVAIDRNLTGFGIALIARGSTEVFFDSKENTSTSQPASLDIPTPGPRGPQGLTGPQGPVGPQGPAGSSAVLSNFSTFQVRDISVSAGDIVERWLSCPAGYPQLVSGGCGYPFFYGSSTAAERMANLVVFYSGPDPNDANGTWQCSANNFSIKTQTLRLYVQCAR